MMLRVCKNGLGLDLLFKGMVSMVCYCKWSLRLFIDRVDGGLLESARALHDVVIYIFLQASSQLTGDG